MPVAAGAIETATFGLDVVEATPDGRLHITTRAGRTATGSLRLFNKTDAPLSVKLTVSPATVHPDGRAELGGADTAVGWVDLPPQPVTLGPAESRTLEIEVRAPRKLPAGRAVVAIVAEPEVAPGAEAPAVLQRVAITTLLEPDQQSLVASLGWYPWLALALLAAVVAWTIQRTGRRTQD